MKLLVPILFVATFAHASNYKVDFLNETHVEHAYRSDDIKFGNDPYARTQVFFPVLRNNTWKGEAKINEQLQAIGHAMLEDKVQYQEFLTYFKENLELILRWDYSYMKEEVEYEGFIAEMKASYMPNDIDVDMDILALNDHILIISSEITYEAKRGKYGHVFKNLSYEKIYYFDLNTGEQIDPKTFIPTDMYEAFYQSAWSKLPDSVKNHIDYVDVKNGKPLFNGASFYLIVKGNSEATHQHDYNYHIRMSLEEVQRYLDKKGPWKRYLTHHEKKPSTVCHMDTERIGGAWYYRDYLMINEEQALFEKLKSPTRIVSGHKTIKDRPRYKKYEAEYDRQGNIQLYRTFERDGETEDSIRYTYYDNGGLRLIQYFDVEYMPDDDPEDLEWYEERFYFDELGNVTQIEEIMDYWNEYDHDFIEHDIGFVHYFGDKVIVDWYYESPYGVGMSDGIDLYHIHDGYLFEVGALQGRKDHHYSFSKKGNEIMYHFKRGSNEYSNTFQLKNNRIVSGTNSAANMTMNVEYTKQGQPKHYEILYVREGNVTQKSVSDLEYNGRNLPTKLTQSNYHNNELNNTRWLEFEYTK